MVPVFHDLVAHSRSFKTFPNLYEMEMLEKVPDIILILLVFKSL